MSNEVITWLKTELAKFEGSTAVKTAETDVEAIGDSAFNFIKTQGLGDLYKIATAALLALPTGGWGALLSTVVTQGEAAGIQIAKGAEAVVVAQAQADLIAAGQLVSPSTSAVVAAPPAA